MSLFGIHFVDLDFLGLLHQIETTTERKTPETDVLVDSLVLPADFQNTLATAVDDSARQF
jgi:hypothetical protein